MARLAAVLCLLAATPLTAQMTLSFADAISESINSNPQMIAAGERINSAQGLRLQARLKPNPRLILQSENLPFWRQSPASIADITDSFAYVGQLIETGGKRARRVEVASENVTRAERERQVLAQQIAGRVGSAYWTAVSAARVRDLLQESVDLFDRLITYQRNRVNEGVLAEADLLRTQIERDRAYVLVRGASQEAERALLAVYREMGRATFAPSVLTEALDEIRPVPVYDIGQVLANRADLQAARQVVAQASANVQLQRANAKPDVDVFAGYKRTIGQNTLYAAVQVPLTLRNRNQGQIASAQADVRAAQASFEAQERQIRVEVESAQRQYEAQRRLVSETLPPLRQRAEENAQRARAVYQEGGYDLLRLLDAERARLEIQTLYFRSLADFQQSRVALQVATGMLP